MSNTTKLMIAVTCLASAGLGACMDSNSDRDVVFLDETGTEVAEVAIDIDTNEFKSAVPHQFVDENGARHVLIGKARTSSVHVDAQGIPQLVDEGPQKPVKRPETLEELADKLRGVTLRGGHEYRQQEPAFELAQQILDSRQAPAETLASPMIESEKPGAEALAEELYEDLDSDKMIIGADTRSVRTNNTAYPWRAMVHSDLGCTGTLISATTILTAAHCVYDTVTNTWKKVGGNWPKYGRGADAGDATVYPYGQFSCYSVTVPGGWVDGNDVLYDYAVIKLECGQSSDNWMGTWTADQSTIESSSTYLYGYPGDKSPYPQMWGHGKTAGGTYVDESHRLRHVMDTAGGQSGAAIYLFNSSGNRRVVGIHKGSNGGTNHGRRWDSTVFNFVDTYSNFPDDT